MIWWLYNFCFVIGFSLMLPRFLWRMARRGGYARNFLQRFGRYAPEIRARLTEGGRVWIHAVSVGEVGVALRLMQELRATRPELRFLLSTTTSTGHAVARKQLDQDTPLIYFPLDVPPISRRIVRLIRPRALLLIENEMWPNLIRTVRKNSVPVVMINARISAHSFGGYRLLHFLTRRLLPQFTAFFAQGQPDADRLIALGAPADRVHVMGSAKYDLAPAGDGGAEKARATLSAAGFAPDRPILLGGSTWAGEEAVLLDALIALRPQIPNLALVLVPRHAERRAEVLREIEVRHLVVVSCSAAKKRERPDVLLVDTTGELRNFYEVADVIFVGKSLTARGGQNIIEPAVCAKPVIVGPNMTNFESIMPDFLAAQAIVQVADAGVFRVAAARLLKNPAEAQAMGTRAAQVVRAKAGALHATVNSLAPLMD
ncbi:MAG: 3-deoxy-D-manno-octulosonic acid transferase [Verrucomicrobia bacterium]|nr:MAG: 3-deoxy-D-manno-octulosonic acid transferase [Verrucomicrobiota bacterium]